MEKVYRDPELFTRMAILKVACTGKFSSDRTIRRYAEEIWRAGAGQGRLGRTRAAGLGP